MSAPCPVLGFIVEARLRTVSREADSEFIVEDLLEVLARNGLEIGRGSGRKLQFAISREGTQATQADRELLLAWGKRWDAVAEVDVSDLIDLQNA